MSMQFGFWFGGHTGRMSGYLLNIVVRVWVWVLWGGEGGLDFD